MDALKTRVRAVGIDRFAGLSGHAYHAARNLRRQPNRADAPDDHCHALARYLSAGSAAIEGMQTDYEYGTEGKA